MSAAAVSATFCATLVDEWVRRGVRHAVAAPGSRSTPMAMAVAERADLALHVVHDERVAGFVALGLGLAGRPAVLLCTSGTAAANFLPAVVEADLSAVPMLVLTADRPPELRGVGAPQTIDQTHLYGRAVRWFHDPGVADHAASGSWRALAARAHRAAADGPVHLNLPFREPLLGAPGELPPPMAASVTDRGARATRLVTEAIPGGTGLILAGGRSGVDPEAVVALADATGWPLLADPTSGLRDRPGVISTADALLRHRPFADAHRPDVVVRIGRPPASKVIAQWIVGSAAPVVQVGGPGTIDPDHNVTAVAAGDDLPALADALTRGDPAVSARWQAADRQAAEAIGAALDSEDELSEPGVARTVAAHLPARAELVVASSMPVRDLEWYGGAPARAHANRGANGIDGVMSTALGIALTGRPTVALVGDIAFVHDAGALTALRRRTADLRIVVVDNDGGGIFSFLPQAVELGGGRFEQLFGTPHGTDVVALAAAHGIDATTVRTAQELAGRLVGPGPTVTRVPTDRAANVARHAELHAAVAAALDVAL